MKEINKIVKAYAKMVVANSTLDDLQDEHFLMSTSGKVLLDCIREIKETANWMPNLYKAFGTDVEDTDAIQDCVADMIQDAVDKMI